MKKIPGHYSCFEFPRLLKGVAAGPSAALGFRCNTREGVPSLCRVLPSDQMQVQELMHAFQNHFIDSITLAMRHGINVSGQINVSGTGTVQLERIYITLISSDV